MSRRIVIDTNLWIRALLGGPVTLPVLEAWRAGKFVVLISQPLLDELLRRQMLERGVKILGVAGLLASLDEEPAAG